jgi:hypothetical protein
VHDAHSHSPPCRPAILLTQPQESSVGTRVSTHAPTAAGPKSVRQSVPPCKHVNICIVTPVCRCCRSCRLRAWCAGSCSSLCWCNRLSSNIANGGPAILESVRLSVGVGPAAAMRCILLPLANTRTLAHSHSVTLSPYRLYPPYPPYPRNACARATARTRTHMPPPSSLPPPAYNYAQTPRHIAEIQRAVWIRRSPRVLRQTVRRDEDDTERRRGHLHVLGGQQHVLLPDVQQRIHARRLPILQ